jgi:hypothetical protein
MLVDSSYYVNLDDEWGKMLDDFELRPALHMKDFGRHGRFADMKDDKQLKIFNRVAELIEYHKIYSMSASLEHKDYLDSFSVETRQNHSAYELCFLGAVLGNSKLAQRNNYQDPIAFVVDSGNPYAKQVSLAHREMEKLCREGGFPSNIGNLTFANDELVSALQAADVICWGARRKATLMRFPVGMAPIEPLLDIAHGHAHIPLEKAAFEALENNWQSRKNQ